MSKISYYTNQFLTGMQQQADSPTDRVVEAFQDTDKGSQFRKLLAVINRNDYEIPSGFSPEVV